ncbi:transposase [Streptomyces sp. NPDC091209]|uniref:transposase n=1 Tax=Streptomyces sp. NPDC091209 TaxID=3365974 RepID=UPI003806E53C
MNSTTVPLRDLLARKDAGVGKIRVGRVLIVAKFTQGQCRPCPVRTRCTTTREGARNVGFPQRKPRDLHLCVRAEQQTPGWKTRATRSAPESRAAPSTSRPRTRHAPLRYRGQPKTHHPRSPAEAYQCRGHGGSPKSRS